MWACPLKPSLAVAAIRSTMRLNPGADKRRPALRNERKGDLGLSRWCRATRVAPGPSAGGCSALPFLTLRMCRDAVLQSIFGQTFKENTHATFTAARVKNVAA
jgi:hypothetical protein